MDRDDTRARADRSLSEPGGSSFGHVQLSDALRVCEAKAVGTGVKFRHRIGGTAATDDRPHEPREQARWPVGQWLQPNLTCGSASPREVGTTAGTGRRTSPGLALA